MRDGIAVGSLTWFQLVGLLELGPEAEAEASRRERHGDTATSLTPAEDL